MLSLGLGPNLSAGAALVPMSKLERGGGSTTTTKTMFWVNVDSIVVDETKNPTAVG